MKCRALTFLPVLSVAFGIVAGCGEAKKPEVKTVEVSGTVYLDDQPLGGASIHFFASEKHEGIGVTGPDGRYTLDNGAEPGENKVYFSKVEGRTAEEMEMDEMESVAAVEDEDRERGPEAGQVIPPKYNDPRKTEVTFNVPAEGTSSADFKLTSQ